VKAKITRSVTEMVICILDSNGNVEEIEEVIEEIDYDDVNLHNVISILSVHP